MAIIITGEAEGHTHTLDTSEESGLTSVNNGHPHPYTLGDEMTEEGGVNDHIHPIPDIREGIDEMVGGVFTTRRDEQWFKSQREMLRNALEKSDKSQEGLGEDVATNFAGGDPNPNIASLNEPFKKGPLVRRKKKRFAGHEVFEVDSETFSKSIKGKPKFARFKNYMSLDDFPNIGQDIKEFAQRNPRKAIILKDNRTGRMLFLKGMR